MTVLITTIAFIAAMLAFVQWAERKKQRDQLNEETKWPNRWEDADEWGW